jgi:purine-binding chemotaxis protein CheW
MSELHQIIVFTLDGQHCGIPLEAVERVVPMVMVTPLPGVPAFVCGVINVQGEIVPVVDLRRLFSLPERQVALDDQLIITRFSGRCMALIADATQGVSACRQEAVTGADDILPDLPFLSGIAKLPDGLILIHDLEQFLSSQESETIKAAVARKLP